MNQLQKQSLLIIVITGYLCWTACQNNQQKKVSEKITDSIPSKSSKKNNSLQGNFSTQTVLHFDSNKINHFITKYPLFKPLQNDIQKFYASRKYTYAWYDKSGIIEQADNLYNRITNIVEEGLPENILYKDSLTELFQQSSTAPNTENELMLTAQYFDYAQKAWGGISEKETKSLDWFLPRKKIDLPFLMDSLLKDPASEIIKNGYTYRQYGLLKDYLKKYRDIESKNKWAYIQPGNKSFKISDSSSIIPMVREKLFLLGDLPVNSANIVFDKDLETAIKKFQYRFGMKEDGIVGAAVIKQLNEPLDKYIRMLIVNMERCRWVPAHLKNNYLIVNIPAFELFSYENDSLLFTMKVVVGKEVHKTVIFNGDLKYVVFSPYWNVPPSIMKNEILPALKKDPAYLQKHNMEWNGNSIRQKPGPKNSLGLVKFLFPNSYNIYLHDSPAKSLFNENARAFSHGCIRVAQPKKLAEYLLQDDPNWTETKIEAAMKKGKEQYVTLKNPVPVFIAYLTTWVDREGKLNIRKDIYNRDERLANMLIKN